MTIDEMRNKLTEYCYGFIHCENGCRLRKPGSGCRWNDVSDESTEDCYHFLERLISKPEQEVQNVTIDQMYKEVKGYCFHTPYCAECRLITPDAVCGWDSADDISTEDCYWFLVNEGLISKPEQPEINFVKAERNDEVEPTNDAVQHPSHYTQGGIECIEAIKASMTADGFCDYCKGNIIKYIWRWRDKGGVEDLRKASVYLDWLINTADVKEKK